MNCEFDLGLRGRSCVRFANSMRNRIGMPVYSFPAEGPDVVRSASQDIIVCSFSDNDGVSASNLNATASSFFISTNSQGQILAPYWGFYVGGPSGELGAADIGEDWSQTNTTYGQTPFEPFGNQWSGPVYSPEPHAPVPTPEPSTAAMFVTAMIAILIRARGETCGGQSENETGRGAARKARGGTT